MAADGRGSIKTATAWGVAAGKTTADLVVADMVRERKRVSEEVAARGDGRRSVGFDRERTRGNRGEGKEERKEKEKKFRFFLILNSYFKI